MDLAKPSVHLTSRRASSWDSTPRLIGLSWNRCQNSPVELAGFKSNNLFRIAHQEMVNESLANADHQRQSQWTESIAVGNKSFVETIKKKLGILAKGRKILETDEGFQLREKTANYYPHKEQKIIV
jgi:hypothetical protein